MRSISAGILCAVLLAACSTTSSGPGERLSSDSPSPTGVPTLRMDPLPEEPPTGELIADMRQTSRDAASGQMQVWVDNDTTVPFTPTRIVYRDPRFREPLIARDLREIPTGSVRGFVLPLPERPTCGRSNEAPVEFSEPVGQVVVAGSGSRRTIPVLDETDVAGRFTRARCLEIGIAEVASVSWADRVVPGDPSAVDVGSTGVLTMVVEPTGATGRTLAIESVTGTPILSASGGPWRPATRIRGDDAPIRIDLPVKPTRCDPHAFQESGGATAFAVNLRLDGEPGQIVLRMSPEGAAHAIEFAIASCGLQ